MSQARPALPLTPSCNRAPCLTDMDPHNFEGCYWHTLDGGDTWTKEAIPGITVLSLDMTSASSGYSAAMDLHTKTVLMKYRPPSTEVKMM